MKRLRGKEYMEITIDPETGQPRILGRKVEGDVLASDGGLDSRTADYVDFLDCGCRGPAAGRCEICNALSCGACHGRCCRCSAPLCLEHSVFVESNGARVRLCKRCFDQSRRKRRLITLGRLLLSPFVQYEDHYLETR